MKRFFLLCALVLPLLASCKWRTPETVIDEDDQLMQQSESSASSADYSSIQDYEACIAAGYPMMKSMPPQCATPDGRVFVQEIEGVPNPWASSSSREEQQIPEHGGNDEDDGSTTGVYTAYYDGVIGNGLESVLFFHAGWCPYCAMHDASLTSWFNAQEFPRSVYKIDYDTQTELKSKYGVVTQDTFILIDGNGNEIRRITFASDEDLKALLMQ